MGNIIQTTIEQQPLTTNKIEVKPSSLDDSSDDELTIIDNVLKEDEKEQIYDAYRHTGVKR